MNEMSNPAPHLRASEELATLFDEVMRDFADLNSIGKQGCKPLVVAINKRSPGLVKIMLERGADPNADLGTGDGATALHVAVDKGMVEAAGLLLAKGADPNACSVQRMTPLHCAVGRNDEAMVTLLLEKGADPEFEARDPTGGSSTPIRLADALRHKRIWQILVAAMKVELKTCWYCGQTCRPSYETGILVRLWKRQPAPPGFYRMSNMPARSFLANVFFHSKRVLVPRCEKCKANIVKSLVYRFFNPSRSYPEVVDLVREGYAIGPCPPECWREYKKAHGL